MQTLLQSVHSLRLGSVRHLPTDTCRQIPHTERGLFSLYVVMPVNLFTGTANMGNLPSCSCVLRGTLETAETEDYFLDFFTVTLVIETAGHSGRNR